MANASQLNLKLGIDISNLDRELGKVEKSLSKFGNSMKNIGTNLTQSLTVPIIGLGIASVKAFSDMEKLEKGLTAIMGSSELAKDEIVKLREVAKLPGLGLKEAVQGSINLQAVGLSAEEAKSTLMGFGTALAAVGKGKVELEAIQYQLTQMISKNKLLAEDYKVIQSNLPLMAEGMRAAFGTSNIEAIRETGISAKDFTLQLSNALSLLPETQNVTGGLSNSFENLSDNIFISLAEFGKAINESLNLQAVAESLSKYIQGLVDGFKSLNPETQGFIVKAALVAASIGPIIFIVGKLISTYGALVGASKLIVQGIGNISKAFTFLAANPMILVVTGLIAAIGAIALYVYDNWQAFADNFKNIWINIKNSVMQGVTFVLGKLDNLQKALGLNLFNLDGMTKYQEEQRVVATRFKTIGETVDSLKGKLASLFTTSAKAEGKGGGIIPTTTTTTTTGGGTGGGKSVDASNPSISAVNLLPTLDLLPEKLESVSAANERLKQTNEDVANSFTKITPAIKSVEDLLSPLQKSLVMGIEAFANLAESGFKSMKELAAAVRQSIAVIIGDMIKVFVAKALAGLPPTPFMLAIAPAVAALAGSLGKNLIMKIGAPKLAEGGLAYGPTMATVGDNRNARVDPEVIAPLSKLKSMMGDMGIGGTLETRISGNDLIILLNRSQKGLSRIQ